MKRKINEGCKDAVKETEKDDNNDDSDQELISSILKKVGSQGIKIQSEVPKSEGRTKSAQSKAPQTEDIKDQPTPRKKLSEVEKTEIKLRRRELARQWREEAARKLMA